MIGRATPWPVAVVTGMLGAGKTTMIGRMLRDTALSDTLVLVNEFGAVGLDHRLLRAVTDQVVLLPNGCLCCTIRSDVVQTLRNVNRAWLTGAMPDFGRILIETTGLAEPAPLIGALASHPQITESCALAALSTVVDGEHGLDQIATSATCRNQIALADRLMIAKADRIDARAVAALTAQVRSLNPLASIERSDRIAPQQLFRRDGAGVSGARFRCDAAPDHLARIATVLLRPLRPLDWSRFRVWLGAVLDTHGARLLRLKGRLAFEPDGTSIVIQAVHHTFYPVIESTDDDDGDAFLVLIFDGDAPVDLPMRASDAGFAIG